MTKLTKLPTLFETPFMPRTNSLLSDVFDSFFHDFYAPVSASTSQRMECNFMPKANIVEKDKEYLVELDLPAVKKDDINISFKNNVLSVEGERKLEYTDEDKNYKRFESVYGKFQRSFAFEHVNNDALKAEYKNGVLKITLPKEEEVVKKLEEKKIPIV